MPLPIAVLIVSFVIEGLLLLFHLSLVACIASNVLKRNSAFKGGFYNLFLLQSIADTLSYTMVHAVFREMSYFTYTLDDLYSSAGSVWLRIQISNRYTAVWNDGLLRRCDGQLLRVLLAYGNCVEPLHSHSTSHTPYKG